MLKLVAQLTIDLKIKKPISEGNPLTIGALTLTSKDGKRTYVLDTFKSEYTNGSKKDGVFYLTANCKLDLDNFPLEDNKYDLTLDDLDDCVGVFYCSDVDNEDGEDCFDYENVEVITYVENLENGDEYIIPVTIEV